MHEVLDVHSAAQNFFDALIAHKVPVQSSSLEHAFAQKDFPLMVSSMQLAAQVEPLGFAFGDPAQGTVGPPLLVLLVLLVVLPELEAVPGAQLADFPSSHPAASMHFNWVSVYRAHISSHVALGLDSPPQFASTVMQRDVQSVVTTPEVPLPPLDDVDEAGTQSPDEDPLDADVAELVPEPPELEPPDVEDDVVVVVVVVVDARVTSAVSSPREAPSSQTLFALLQATTSARPTETQPAQTTGDTQREV